MANNLLAIDHIKPEIFDSLGWLTVVSTRRGQISLDHPYGHNFGWSLPQSLTAGERQAEQRRIAARLDLAKHSLALSHIATITTEHKNRIIKPALNDDRAFALPIDERHVADGFYVDTPRLGAAIFPADCAVIILADRARPHFCMVHAGWRGLYSQIITDGVNLMTAQGTKPRHLLAYLAPHAKDRFPLSRTETIEQFKSKFPRHTHNHLIDQTGIALQQLADAGITADRIEVSPHSTLTSNDFYSHHYPDPEGEGRFMVLAAITPAQG